MSEPKSPQLLRHEHYRDAIKGAKNPQELNSIRVEYMSDTSVTESSKGTLNAIYAAQAATLKALFTASPGRAAPAYASPQDRVAETHKEVDTEQGFITPEVAEEVFSGPTEVIIPNSHTNETPKDIPANPTSQVPDTIVADIPMGVESNPTQPTPLNAESNQPDQGTVEQVSTKKSRAPRGTRSTPESGQPTGGTVTLSREVKFPINGVQFSNNLFGMTVTASSYDEARTILDDSFIDFTHGADFVSKDQVTMAYNQGYEKGLFSVPVKNPTIAQPTKAVYDNNLDRAKALINQFAVAIPEAKEFMKGFMKLNPAIPEGESFK